MLYAEIAIPLKIPTTLIYLIPTHLQNKIKPGQKILVPFRKKQSIGYVISINKDLKISVINKKIKEINDILDQDPVFSKEMLELLTWMSNYYCAPIGEVCKSALPSKLNSIKDIKINKIKRPYDLEIIYENKEEKLILNKEQQDALNLITQNIQEKNSKPILLHGITGSGKTEVYLNAFEELEKTNSQGLLLAPEISLTPQLVQRFVKRFKDKVSIYHSGLTNAQRYNEWLRIKNGDILVCIGTRSALFAPFSKLGLIIVDEEHDSSYKQEEGFLYNARDAGIMRAKFCNLAIVLGSATPSVESYTNTKTNKYSYFYLSQRATGASLPKIEVVDMREHKKTFLSKTLIDAIKETTNKKEQALIFLNRRGFANFLLCRDCGQVFECPNCNIGLTHHLKPTKLICHYCDFSIIPPNTCPQCKSLKLELMGQGTQRIEDDIAQLFPDKNITRLDKDSVSKVNSRRTFLKKMQNNEIDILIGTQLVAKGHDFPNVTLVGIINADVSMHLPDFRSFEKTFQLLTQVAGRSGRGDKPGKVIIQTYQPEHPSIVYATSHDFYSFFEVEKEHRQALKYPPFMRIANLRFSGNNNQKTENGAKISFEILDKKRKSLNIKTSIDLLGPAPAPLNKIRGKFRWQLLIKGKGVKEISMLLRNSLPQINNQLPSGCSMIVDIDPANML